MSTHRHYLSARFMIFLDDGNPYTVAHAQAERLWERSLRIALIANPVSGTGKARAKTERLVKLLEAAGCTVEIQWTQKSGHAKILAAKLADGFDCLVVAGGDGSVSEVLNGLPLPSPCPIAILGVGSQNILARELGLDLDPASLAKAILAGNTCMIDLGLIDGMTRFGMLCTAGLDARVIRTIAENRQGTLGSIGYLWALLRTVFTYPQTALQVTVDDHPPVSGTLVIVANIKNYVWDLHPADQAECDSGKLDVVVLHKSGAIAVAGYMWQAWRNRLSTSKQVSYLQGIQIELSSTEDIDVQNDGEVYGKLPVHIELLPGVAAFVVPEDRA
ncbi:MAG: diacylglycerol kinase (ATP) [Kiritimatiellia bacterium]|jgi:diacylglycerol kinase (ATP)